MKNIIDDKELGITFIRNPYIGITTDGDIEIFIIRTKQPLNLSELRVFNQIYEKNNIYDQQLTPREIDYNHFKKLGITGERLEELENIFFHNQEKIKKRTIFESISVNNEENYVPRIAIEESYDREDDNLEDFLEKGTKRRILTNGQEILRKKIACRDVTSEEYKEYEVNCILEKIIPLMNPLFKSPHGTLKKIEDCQIILNLLREKNNKNKEILKHTKKRSI